MEQPIFVPAVPLSHREEPSNLGYIFENAIRFDDKDEFLLAIRHPGFIRKRHILVEPLSIFQYDAVRIATAVFEGKSKGVYDVKHMLMDGMPPIHLAAACRAPKLTKYLIERGDSHSSVHNFKQPSPIDLALESMERVSHFPCKDDTKFWTPHMSIMELLVTVCHHRRGLECVRLLVQNNTINEERVMQAFIDYANKGKLHHLTALFLAVPDLFLPSTLLSLLSSSLEKKKKKRTIIQEEDGMSLLLDVFAAVGDKLVAAIRVDNPNILEFGQAVFQSLITCLLREVAYHKLGGGASSRNDYFLRFFVPVDQLSSHMPKLHDNVTSRNIPKFLYFQMRRHDIDIDYINGKLSLEADKAVVLYTAIANKLSSMSRFHGLFLEMDIAHRLAVSDIDMDHPVSMEQEKYLPIWFSAAASDKKFEPVFNSFHKKAAITTRPKYKFDFKLSPRQYLEKKVVMQPQSQTTKLLNSSFSLLKGKGSKLNIFMALKRFMRG